MKKLIDDYYGGQLRVRVNGILIENDAILLVKLKGIGDGGKGDLWIPPGGGMEYGSDIRNNLVREFKEETGLEIAVKKLLFINEYLKHPLHTLELFFEVKRLGGKLQLGMDPEFSRQDQILDDIKFFTFADVKKLNKNTLHNLFQHCDSIDGLLKMNGYFNY